MNFFLSIKQIVNILVIFRSHISFLLKITLCLFLIIWLFISIQLIMLRFVFQLTKKDLIIRKI